MRLLIMIPAYNEAGNIVKTVEDIRSHCDDDFVIINDGSRDNTLKICQEHGYPVIAVPVNSGLASTIQLGFEYALKHDYDAALQFDGDGQHQAMYISKMKEALEQENADIVIGSRFIDHKKGSTMRNFGSRILTALIKLTTKQRITDPTSGMRMYGRTVIEEFAENINYPPEPNTLVFLMNKGAKVKEIAVEMKDREAGTSYLRPLRAMKYMLEMIISIIFIEGFRER